MYSTTNDRKGRTMRVRIIEPIKAKEKVKKRVCAYVRVSTFTSSKGESFENQVGFMKEFI